MDRADDARQGCAGSAQAQASRRASEASSSPRRSQNASRRISFVNDDDAAARAIDLAAQQTPMPPVLPVARQPAPQPTAVPKNVAVVPALPVATSIALPVVAVKPPSPPPSATVRRQLTAVAAAPERDTAPPAKPAPTPQPPRQSLAATAPAVPQSKPFSGDARAGAGGGGGGGEKAAARQAELVAAQQAARLAAQQAQQAAQSAAANAWSARVLRAEQLANQQAQRAIAMAEKLLSQRQSQPHRITTTTAATLGMSSSTERVPAAYADPPSRPSQKQQRSQMAWSQPMPSAQAPPLPQLPPPPPPVLAKYDTQARTPTRLRSTNDASLAAFIGGDAASGGGGSGGAGGGGDVEDEDVSFRRFLLYRSKPPVAAKNKNAYGAKANGNTWVSYGKPSRPPRAASPPPMLDPEMGSLPPISSAYIVAQRPGQPLLRRGGRAPWAPIEAWPPAS